MRKSVLLLLTLLLLAFVAGCAPPAAQSDARKPVPKSVATSVATSTRASTSASKPTWTPAPTPALLDTSKGTSKTTSTPAPVVTPTPAPKATSTPAGQSKDVTVGKTIALNDVKITVKSLRLEPFEKAPGDVKFFLTAFGGPKPRTLGVMDVLVENEGKVKAVVMPGAGIVVAGDEQVRTLSLSMGNLDGVIYPGVVKEGTVVFALTRYEPGQVRKVQYHVDAPYSESSSVSSEEEFTFDIGIR